MSVALREAAHHRDAQRDFRRFDSVEALDPFECSLGSLLRVGKPFPWIAIYSQDGAESPNGLRSRSC